MKSSKRRHDRARADFARASKLALAGVRHEQRVTDNPEVTGLLIVKRKEFFAMARLPSDSDDHKVAERRYQAACARLDELARERQERMTDE